MSVPRPDLRKADTLALRVVSAVVMVPAGLGVVWLGGWVLLVAALLTGLVMWLEYWSVCTNNRPRSTGWYSGGLTLAALCIALMLKQDHFPALVMGGTTIVALALTLDKTGQFTWLLLGFLVVAAAIVSLMYVRSLDGYGLFLTISIMVCVWSTDIAAYFAGRGFGGPQLSPTNSPNKTWSGAAGAVICTALIGALIAGLLKAPVLSWLVFAGGISLVAQAGDLIQSGWKRHFKVKDSGAIIPGHGGFLDRLDSFSAALIVVTAGLMIIPDFPETFLGLEPK